MHLIVCVEERYGMTFNNRRLSRDKALTQWILELVGQKTLYLSLYSAQLFGEGANLTLSPEPLSQAGEEDFCFAEREDIQAHARKIRTLFLCRWNRRYPADKFFPRELLAGKVPENVWELPGSSHETITVERYVL